MPQPDTVELGPPLLNSAEVTICAACKHLHDHAGREREHWRRWLCMASPQQPRLNVMTGNVENDPPYTFCHWRNHGACGDYSAGPNVLNPVRNEATA